MHLHLFGRAREQVHQVRGQHIALFPKDHPLYRGHLKPLTGSDIRALKARIAAILRQPKYNKLADLAEI